MTTSAGGKRGPRGYPLSGYAWAANVKFNYEGALLLLENGADPYKTKGFFSMAQSGETQLNHAIVLNLLQKSKNFTIHKDQDKFLYINLAMERYMPGKEDIVIQDGYEKYLTEEEYKIRAGNMMIDIVKCFIDAGAKVSDEAILDSYKFESKELTIFLMDHRSKS